MALRNRSGIGYPHRMQSILILGAAVWPNGPSPTLRRRAAHAARLWHANPEAEIIACGGLGQHPPSEADAMHDLLIAGGVAESAIEREDQSSNTLENIKFGAQLAKGDEIIIVTDTYHARRALMVARHFGLNATADCPDPTGRHIKHRLREVIAVLGYWVKLRAMPQVKR
ncbi:YdcF family protein [Loktanella sp. Alg231-35]|uniref:YdcF family protein n=1 Tax=Loktanella sp. Alg231-35 TaxID=1922220 RepID=UPI001F2F688A|nr:YdcF family protein [Loktanella sp. Alg231-35]